MSKDALLQTYNRIKPYVHRTPVLTSQLLNSISGATIFFKCENFQKGGAYKMRGATNAIMQLTEIQRAKGVVTHSSGNFAQAIALGAKSLGVTAHIVMPTSAPKVKKEAVLGYGGIVIDCEPTLKARVAQAAQIVAETGATFLHPSNDTNVILGQGTAAIELLEEQPDLRTILTPIGGGGLIAGSALAAHYFGKSCTVVGGEPFEADDAYRSLLSGKIEGNETVNTIADGLKTQLGDKNFPIIKEHVDRIIRVTESEIIAAMQLIWERMKIIVEPSSAVAFAAVLREPEHFKDQKVGIIISGGNVNVQDLPF